MFLRNLDAISEHCSGEYCSIVSFHDHVVEAEIASDLYAVSTLLKLRIPHVSQEMKFLFTFTRKQFPMKPTFALTFDKTQGQSFEQIGMYIPTQFFS